MNPFNLFKLYRDLYGLSGLSGFYISFNKRNLRTHGDMFDFRLIDLFIEYLLLVNDQKNHIVDTRIKKT